MAHPIEIGLILEGEDALEFLGGSAKPKETQQGADGDVQGSHTNCQSASS